MMEFGVTPCNQNNPKISFFQKNRQIQPTVASTVHPAQPSMVSETTKKPARKNCLSLDRQTDRRSDEVPSSGLLIETPIHPLSQKICGLPARSVGGKFVDGLGEM